MDNYVPEIEEYQKRLNWYLQEHYPAYKKITSEEWNALFMALVNQGNAQEDTLAQICNSILPVHVTTINELIDVTNNHSSQISSLENSINTHTQEISALETLAQSNKTRLNTVEPVVSTHTQKITALETLTQSNKTRLNTIEPIVSTHTQDITALGTLAQSNKTRLNTVEPIVSNHSTHISSLETLTTQHTAAIASKQAQITTSNKLDADLIKNGVNNKVFTAEEKTKLSTLENTPIASLSTLGKIKPDGSTVVVDSDGTLHSQSSVGSVAFSAITGNAKDNTSLATELAKKLEEKNAVPTQPIDPFANYYNKQETQNLISNPNLLINGDFRINQRGEPSYTGANKYTVDRWQLIMSNSSCSVSTNKVSISLSQQFSKFRQFVEDFEFLKGKQVTISAKISNYVHNRTYHTCFEVNSGVDENIRVFLQNGIITATGVFNADATKCEVEFYNYSSGTGVDSFDVEWVKLEVGNIATPFSPRPYAEELAMCQRYYIAIKPYTNYQDFGFGIAISTTVASFHIPVPVTLRSLTGTLTLNGNFRFHSGGNTFNYSGSNPTVANQRCSTNGIMIDFTWGSNILTAGNVVQIRSDGGGYIEYDAEIY